MEFRRRLKLRCKSGSMFSPIQHLGHGEHALDSADAEARRRVEVVAAQALDDILLAELEVVVGRQALLELLQGLVAQVAAIHQEQDPASARELDQMVDGADGGRPCRSRWPSGSTSEEARSFRAIGRRLLRDAKFFETCVLEPIAQPFRSMESRHRAGAGLRIQPVGEAGFVA